MAKRSNRAMRNLSSAGMSAAARFSLLNPDFLLALVARGQLGGVCSLLFCRSMCLTEYHSGQVRITCQQQLQFA